MVNCLCIESIVLNKFNKLLMVSSRLMVMGLGRVSWNFEVYRWVKFRMVLLSGCCVVIISFSVIVFVYRFSSVLV